MTETRRLTIPAAEALLDRYFPVLDHGFIALKDYMGGDEAIDEAARTSYGAGNRKVNERRGLIRTLRRNLHTSPFEMCELKFHCSMPIFVARDWIRHRTANVNEYSGRYSVMPMMFYMPRTADMRKQSKTNKQGGEGVVSTPLVADAQQRFHEQRQRTTENYEWMIEADFARELARIDLPLSTYTQWYWKIDLHNLLHFLGLRCDSRAQYELRAFANIMAGMAKHVAPLSFEAWIDYFFAGVRMSRMEMGALRRLVYLTSSRLLTAPHGELKETLVLETEGKSLYAEDLAQHGLSATEIGEFFSKFEEKKIPTFDLDLSLAKDGAFFAQQWEDAVPKIDRAST